MSKVFKRGSSTAEMNMTPLIDVTFQLIIFFMLVNNIISEETVEMIVPKLEDSAAQELGEVDRVVVNVAPQPFSEDRGKEGNDPLIFDGQPTKVKVAMAEFDPGDLDGITEALKAAKSKNPEVEVLLRSDAAIYYREIQGVMQAIANAEIVTVNLVAYRSEENQ